MAQFTFEDMKYTERAAKNTVHQAIFTEIGQLTLDQISFPSSFPFPLQMERSGTYGWRNLKLCVYPPKKDPKLTAMRNKRKTCCCQPHVLRSYRCRKTSHVSSGLEMAHFKKMCRLRAVCVCVCLCVCKYRMFRHP